MSSPNILPISAALCIVAAYSCGTHSKSFIASSTLFLYPHSAPFAPATVPLSNSPPLFSVPVPDTSTPEFIGGFDCDSQFNEFLVCIILN
jgi:hypothetical protein